MSETNIKDVVEFLVENLFKGKPELLKKVNEYRENMQTLFNTQGELVLYPNNEVTCFKAMGRTYYNPSFGKISRLKVDVHLRHLHPSLVPTLQKIERDFNDIGLNQRRLQSYFDRGLRYFSACCHEQAIHRPEQLFVYSCLFLLEIIPNCFALNHSITLYRKEVMDAITVNHPSDIVYETVKYIKQHANDYQNNELEVIKSFTEYVFRIDVLGL